MIESLKQELYERDRPESDSIRNLSESFTSVVAQEGEQIEEVERGAIIQSPQSSSNGLQFPYDVSVEEFKTDFTNEDIKLVKEALVRTFRKENSLE